MKTTALIHIRNLKGFLSLSTFKKKTQFFREREREWKWQWHDSDSDSDSESESESESERERISNVS